MYVMYIMCTAHSISSIIYRTDSRGAIARSLANLYSTFV